MSGKIALLGAAPSSREFAPFAEIDWEIWACSPPNYQAPRVDAWFELHNLDRKMQHAGNAPYIELLKRHARVYVSAIHPLFPHAILYPKDEVMAEFHPYMDYFATSSLAWMMAKAIMLKPDMIGLWGVDMSATEEYGYQRAGCHFFICEARRRGIDVYVPPQSDLLQPIPLYGFKEHSRMFWKQKARLEELTKRLQDTEAHQDRLNAERRVFQGAIDDLNYVNNTWLDDGRRDWPTLGVLPAIKPKPGFKEMLVRPAEDFADGKDTGGTSLPSAQEPGSSPERDDPERPGV